jgi:hypothetical protein
MWRRWNEQGSSGRFEFFHRASLYALLAAVPVLALALASAQQHVRVPGLAVFLLLSAAQAGACVALLHASLSFSLAGGHGRTGGWSPRPSRSPWRACWRELRLSPLSPGSRRVRSRCPHGSPCSSAAR